MDNIETLREQAFYLLGRTIARIDPGRLEAWVGLGLTITQLRVLFILRAEDGAPAGTLAYRLGVTPSTLTRIMDRLVRHDLVRRQVDDDDRRLVRHYLTAAGLRTVEEMERASRTRMDDIFGRLSRDQMERLVQALEELAAATESAEADERSRVEV